jgi:hypothetical protein
VAGNVRGETGLVRVCVLRAHWGYWAYMTTRDIAAYLGVKPSTVTAYVAREQVPPADAVGWLHEALAARHGAILGRSASPQGLTPDASLIGFRARVRVRG